MRGIRGVTLLVIGASAIGIAGFVVGSQIESSSNALAGAEPPAPTILTVPVEFSELDLSIVRRGTARFVESTDVAAPQWNSSSLPIVTRAPTGGETIGEGEVLFEIANRPVLVLRGNIPMFQEFVYGATGDDVTQLQSALARLGFDPGPIDGVYGPLTRAATAALFDGLGYKLDPLDRDETDSIDEASNRVVDADKAYDTAVESGEPAAELLQELERARRDAQRVEADAAGVVALGMLLFVPRTPAQVGQVFVGLGQLVDGPVMSLTGSDVIVETSLPSEFVSYAAVGLEIELTGSNTGVSTTGTILELGATPGTRNVGPADYYLAIRVAGEDALTLTADDSILVTIPLSSTRGPVLSVPVSALVEQPDGTIIVSILDGGVTRSVVVRVGLVARGIAEVESASGSLEAGDLVIIGIRK